jgi:hypothetical protein
MTNNLQHKKSLDEEIKDLSSYLEGIPAVLRSTGAFAAYEARLELLRQELAATKNASVGEGGGMAAPATPTSVGSGHQP